MKYFLFFSLFFILSCGSEPSESVESTEAMEPQEEREVTTMQNKPLVFTTNLDNLRLRNNAGTDGEEIARLPIGTKLFDEGEVSDFTTALKLRGVPFNEPWIKVKTSQGISGWIYAGGLSFDLDASNPMSEELMQKRLTGMFGQNLANAIRSYRTHYEEAKTSEMMAKAYIEGLEVRDDFVEVLGEKIEVNYDQLPDLFWLEQAMPGYLPQMVAEGTMYYLFNDYKQFQDKASKTEGEEDDAMAQLLLHIFDADSVEHFFSSWYLQTWDYGGHSLLGKGIHLRLLQEMEMILEESKLFQKPILDLKTNMVNDIITGEGSERAYWEPKDKATAELASILKSGFKLFTEADVVALETRLKMFEKSKENKIEFNARSGMEG